MNLIVLGPNMEERPLPIWALRPVPNQSQSPLETLIRRIGEEVYNRLPVTILGLPWVNPRGRGRLTASLIDYLDDPVYLRRALEVAFISPRASNIADGAVVACDICFETQLLAVKDWLTPRLSRQISLGRIVWHCFDPDFATVFESEVNNQETDSVRELAENRAIPGTNPTLGRLCQVLGSLFQ